VEVDDQPELRSFAIGIRQDLAAVAAQLTLPDSSSSTEKATSTHRKRLMDRRTAAPASTFCASVSSIIIAKLQPKPITLAGDVIDSHQSAAGPAGENRLHNRITPLL
jgi:hypothetical protein